MDRKQEQHHGIELWKYWAIVSRGRFWALSVFLLILTAVTALSYLLPDIYEATSLVLIEKTQVLEPLLKGMAVDSRSEVMLRTIKKNMLSRHIIEQVIKKLDLDTKASTPAQYENLIAKIQDKTRIRVQGTDLFEISFQGEDPEVVRDLINSLVSTYIEVNMGSARGGTYKAMGFIEDQIMEYKEKLDESDRMLREFKEKNPGIINMNEAGLLERLRSTRLQVSQFELQLKGFLKEKDSLEAQLKGEEPLAVTMMSKSGTAEGRLAEAKSRLTQLLAQYTEMHPEVRKLKSEISELEKYVKDRTGEEEIGGEQEVGINPIYQQLKERLSQSQTNIDLTRAKIEELNRLIKSDEETLRQIPREQEELTRLTRGREVYQNMYDSLMARLESARVSNAMEEADKGESFRVMDPAVLPVHPVEPDRVRFILLAFILAVGGGFFTPIGLDMLNPKCRDVDEVEKLLGFTVIATVPIIQTAPQIVRRTKQWRTFVGVSTIYVGFILVLFAREIAFRFYGRMIF